MEYVQSTARLHNLHLTARRTTHFERNHCVSVSVTQFLPLPRIRAFCSSRIQPVKLLRTNLNVHSCLVVTPALHSVGLGSDRLCGLVVRVLGYRSGGPGSIPGTTRKKK
jgi:hypothetical protein